MLSKERLGRFTASRIADLFFDDGLTPKQMMVLEALQKKDKLTAKQEADLKILIDKRDSPKTNVTRDKYVFEKAEESVLGHAKQFSNKHTEHGHMNEFEAIQSFTEVTGLLVEPLSEEFFKINENCGATPDGKVIDFDGNIIASMNAKCPTETFFKAKMDIINKSKPQYQNVPKTYFYQAQMEMMALGVKEHYLVWYLTKVDMDYDGNKIEYDLPLNVRLFYKKITADEQVQKEILALVEEAAKERDLLIQIFKSPIIEPLVMLAHHDTETTIVEQDKN